jgi:tRNA/rRNA methyltransferase
MKTAPTIILVEPQKGENIGAAARAMLNFGLTDLRLVNPRDGWPSKPAQDMAVGALEKMPPVQIFDTLAAAAHDIHYMFATTARPREMVKPIHSPYSAIHESRSRINENQKTAFVFGPERAGLTNDDVAACHAILTMTTNPDFSSLNIAAAVMIICYEWMAAQGNKDEVVRPTGASFPVEHAKMEELMIRLESDLERGGFFRDDGHKPTMVRNIRNLFARTGMTDQEVRTFHGMLSALTGKKSAH